MNGFLLDRRILSQGVSSARRDKRSEISYDFAMRTYILAGISVILLFVGNAMGEWWGFYDSVNGYDNPMHLLGGFAVGMLALAVLQSFKTINIPVKYQKILVITWVVIVSVAWEFIEIKYTGSGNPFGTMGYWLDTSKDFLCDLVGAVVATLTIRV